MKPILFNTDMVRAILEGRKTVTRRVVKFKPGLNPQWTGYIPDGQVLYGSNNIPASKSPYHPGDILYVRETWAKRESDRCKGIETGRCPFETCETAHGPCFNEEYIYKATDSLPTYGGKWHPSIHMPKEAARMFLRVTDVRAERLQAITIEDIQKEGLMRENVRSSGCTCAWATDGCMDEPCSNRDSYEWLCWATPFQRLWDSTVKATDRDQYGWSANPWVWVIEFERVSKEAALKGGEG